MANRTDSVSLCSRWQVGKALELLLALAVAAVLVQPRLSAVFDYPLVATFSTIFLSITLQALPFLVFGVVLSGTVAAALPPGWLAAHLPRREPLAVTTAALAGVALPGCECGSVPIAGRLVRSGAPPPAALAFMLAAPAINPVVLVATAVAFPGQPRMVAARFSAALVTAIGVGLLWRRLGVDVPRQRAGGAVRPGATRLEAFAVTMRHDFLHAGGWLVVGGLTAATLQVFVPRTLLDAVAGSEWLAVPTLSLLAVMLAICSEADAFVAAGLNQFSLTARLAFLVVGPTVDVKLVALQTGIFGRRFAARLAPLTLSVAVVAALIAGALLL